MNAAFGKYLAALLLFGSNGVVASMILLSSYDIVLLRTCIGSLLLLILFFITGQRLDFFKNKRSALFLAASGACMGAPGCSSTKPISKSASASPRFFTTAVRYWL